MNPPRGRTAGTIHPSTRRRKRPLSPNGKQDRKLLRKDSSGKALLRRAPAHTGCPDSAAHRVCRTMSRCDAQNGRAPAHRNRCHHHHRQGQQQTERTTLPARAFRAVIVRDHLMQRRYAVEQQQRTRNPSDPPEFHRRHATTARPASQDEPSTAAMAPHRRSMLPGVMPATLMRPEPTM